MSSFWKHSKDVFQSFAFAKLFSRKKTDVDYDPGKDSKKTAKRSESRFFRLPKSKKREKMAVNVSEEEGSCESPEIATTLRKTNRELHKKLKATGYSTLERIRNSRKRSRSVDSVVSKESNEHCNVSRKRPATGMFKFARTLGDIPAAVSSSANALSEKATPRNLVSRTSTTRLKIMRKNELSIAIRKFATKRRSTTQIDEDAELFNPCPLKKMSNTSLSCQHLNCSYASTDGGVSSGGATTGGGDSPSLLRAFSMLSLDDGIHMSIYREETTAEPSTETII